MIRSMTGYGRGEGVLHDRAITVEVRAVNNRYLDCNIRLPRLYLFAEEAMKVRIQNTIFIPFMKIFQCLPGLFR